MNLNNLSVMVTRPQPAGEILCQHIEAAGGKAIYFPTIVFSSLTDTDIFKEQIATLDQQDWLIFISPQAVYASSEIIHAQWAHFPKQVKIAALGLGTAKALKAAKLPVDIYPETSWHSEGVLDLPVFKKCQGKKITLFQGEGGREHLAPHLSARGAAVSLAIAYRRCRPSIAVDHYVNLLHQHQIDCIVCTSSLGLSHLKALLESAWDSLRLVPIILVSQRLAVFAEQLGFKKILLANNASHDAIIEALYQQE